MNRDRTTFWSRVGHWLRPSVRPDGESFGDDLMTATSNARADVGSASRSAMVGDEGVRLTSRLRFGPREPALDRLEEGYAKVAGLVESIQRHLQSQDERSAAMAKALDRLAESLSHSPEASRTQLELLSNISRQIEAQSAGTRRFEDSLAQLPQLADAQRETMAAIGRQMDLSRQSADRSMSTLEGFQLAVTRLGDATSASTSALREMHVDSAAREERLAGLLHEQTKRFTFFAVLAIAVAVVAAVIGLVALLR